MCFTDETWMSCAAWKALYSLELRMVAAVTMAASSLWSAFSQNLFWNALFELTDVLSVCQMGFGQTVPSHSELDLVNRVSWSEELQFVSPALKMDLYCKIMAGCVCVCVLKSGSEVTPRGSSKNIWSSGGIFSSFRAWGMWLSGSSFSFLNLLY